MSRLTRVGRSAFTAFLTLFIVFNSLVAPGYALTESERKNLDTPFFDEGSGLCDSSISSTISGSDNISKIYNYLIGKPLAGQPLKDFQVAGIMGNMQHESGYQEQRLQGTRSGTVTPAESLTPAQLADPRLGWGIVQWTPVTKVINPLRAAGKNPNDLQTQLDFLLEQLNAGSSTLDGKAGLALAAATNTAEATVSFELKFERHAPPAQPTRIIEAERILKLASTGSLTDTAAATTPGGAGNGKVIALDPGHGGEVPQYVDPVTHLPDRETTNPQESADVQNVADRIKTDLETAGYQVVMLKSSVNQAVNKRERVDAATAAKASLAISLHTTPPTSFNQVWPQFVGGFRATHDDSIKVTFNNQATAAESYRVAGIMAEERQKAEGHTVERVVGQSSSFSKDRPGLPSYGDISLVQLWSKDIPWVYNEFGTSGALTEQQKSAYETGVVSAVKRAVPLLTDSSASNNCGSTISGDLSSTILTYAWPDYRGSGYTDPKPEYAAAVTTARSAGQYVGGQHYIGIDCGGFVTRVMLNSGYEPRYNYGGIVRSGAGPTGNQLSWVRANWQLVGRGNTLSTADLKPGDVAFRVNSDGSNDGHTFMFAGDIPAFGSKIASASLDDRAPMAGAENALGSNIEWYRKR